MRSPDRDRRDEGARGNDLTKAALRVEPALARWRDAFGELTGKEPRLAGSGATWFVEGVFGGSRVGTTPYASS